MDSVTQQQYLQAMGIRGWRLREDGTPAIQAEAMQAVKDYPLSDAPSLEAELDKAIAEPPPPILERAAQRPAESSTSAVASVDWPSLEASVKACTACGLCEGRIQAVFGVGVPDADLMVIGEGPGAEEDKQGYPFVGPAGQLLDKMLAAINYSRAPTGEQRGAYIANIVKCRPPNNRDPLPEEAAACRTYLEQQIRLVQPRLILAVGRVAAQNLLNTDAPLGRMRGQLHHHGEKQMPVMVTYHPAYLLRSPGEKRKAWDDLKQARDLLQQ